MSIGFLFFRPRPVFHEVSPWRVPCLLRLPKTEYLGVPPTASLKPDYLAVVEWLSLATKRALRSSILRHETNELHLGIFQESLRLEAIVGSANGKGRCCASMMGVHSARTTERNGCFTSPSLLCSGNKHVFLCGIELYICVLQTVAADQFGCMSMPHVLDIK